MEHERNYWICQITGWSLYALSTVMLSAAFGVYSWSNFASQVLSCGIGLTLTHLFRINLRRQGWLRLSLASLVPRIVAVCVFGAIVWMSLMLPLSIFVFKFFTIAQIEPAVVFVMVFNWSATLFIWSLIYFGFHYVENMKKTEVEKVVAEIVRQRELLAAELQKFSFVTRIYPSDANFLLIKTSDANRIYKYLVEQKIVVRNRTNVELCAGCLRITIGTTEENRTLLSVLSSYEE